MGYVQISFKDRSDGFLMPPDWAVKLGPIRHPDEVLLLVECNSGWNVQGYDARASAGSPEMCYDAYRTPGPHLTVNQARHTTHGEKWNYLFVDGHVAAMRLEDTLRRRSNGTVDLASGSHFWTRDPND